MIKVFEAFAGYGSQAMALKRLKENYPGFNYEVVVFLKLINTLLRRTMPYMAKQQTMVIYQR